MSTQKHTLGKTHITRCPPWDTNARNGHAVLCSDGIIRACTLAATADTFFSTPASIRIKGKSVSGYVTVTAKDDMSTDTELATYCFRHHTCHSDKLPDWPSYDSTPATDAEKAALDSEGGGIGAMVDGRYERARAKLNSILTVAHT